MQSGRGRLARSRRPNHERASFGQRQKLSLNGDPKAVVSPTVAGLGTPGEGGTPALQSSNSYG